MPYPPIYVINLNRTPERKLYIQRQLDTFNLNYEFVEAIDKYDLRSKTKRAIIFNELGINKTIMEFMDDVCSKEQQYLGKLACVLSHIKVYNLMIENNIPHACVLEDDTYLLPYFPRILMAAQEIPWDMLMLSSQSSQVRRKLLSGHLGLWRLICYKKYYPNLTFFTVRLIIFRFIKFLIFKKITQKIFSKYKHIGKEHSTQAFIWLLACEVGAIPNPNRHSWHKVAPNHYITTVEKHSAKLYDATSGMAYMLTQSAAIKCKQTATSLPLRAIDLIPMVLYKKGALNLYIVTSPCSQAAYQFLVNSARG